jgi:hypothetical protein
MLISLVGLVSLVIMSCGGKTIFDHSYLAGTYAGTWQTNPQTGRGHGTITVSFGSTGDMSGTLTQEGSSRMYNLAPDYSSFDVNVVNLTFFSTDTEPYVINFRGVLTKSGPHLSGTLKIPAGDFDIDAQMSLDAIP